MPKAAKNSGLKRQIANLKREVNPTVKARPIRGNPKPINTNKTVYVSRTYSVSKTAASNFTALSKGDIVSRASVGEDIRIDFIKCYNTTTGSGLKAKLLTSKVIDPSTGPKDIESEDFGTASSLAGIGFDIPMTLAMDITEGTSTDNVIELNTGGVTDRVLFHVGVRMAI